MHVGEGHPLPQGVMWQIFHVVSYESIMNLIKYIIYFVKRSGQKDDTGVNRLSAQGSEMRQDGFGVSVVL